ncbi:MAG: terpene cyclase/mutase family protein [Sedimentisphaerales bacterium]|nr:terpene cyclase/mutase family protein [Sedimentisphaerales bacterium]
MKRREFLKTAAMTLSLTVTRTGTAVRSAPHSWTEDICRYLGSLRRSDGGYAWPDQPRSHLTPSYAAVGCYHLLGQEPPDKAALAEFLRTHHPFQIKKLERPLKVFEFQQIQSLLWLGQDVSSFREQISEWTKPAEYPKNYERDGYPVLQMEAMAVLSRSLIGLPIDRIEPGFIEYFRVRQRPNGSFNNTPADDGGDGHVMNTWWSIQALEALNTEHNNPDGTIDWIQKCQRPGGGFTYQPEPAFAGIEDVTYTWAAVRALKHRNANPAQRQACVDNLRLLWNADGGFSARPGWPSNPVATYRALDVLKALDTFDLPSSFRPMKTKKPSLPRYLKVFTSQIEAGGSGSCIEAVELARALRIHLWGAKNAPSGWIEHAQKLADDQGVPVTFFKADEEYGTFVHVPGMGTYSHTSDIIAPANVDCGSPLQQNEPVSWEEFRRRRLQPLQHADGRLIWQFGENEELTRLYLDDSLQRGGYAAISTFHFGNPDFTNSEPFLKQYWQNIPFIALQDAHGKESWWWAERLAGFRTLFLATEPTWAGWIKALQNNWVVAVRHDGISKDQTWMHGGPLEVVDFVREREEQWRWWDNPSVELPLVSLVAVTPEDRWEAARPDQGITMRVRCRWDCTTQGLPKVQRVELLELKIDGKKVKPTLVAPKARWGAYQDHYYSYHIAQPSEGRHTAVATIRVLEDRVESSRTIAFTV